jgi:ATP-dependent Clp protease adapter protein ClpS
MSTRPPFRRPNRLARFFGRRPTSPGGRPITRYKVILHRATDKDLPFVARTLRDVTHFADAEATFRMWDAYQNGRTLVLVTHLERAELYVEQFGARGLAASVEPA